MPFAIELLFDAESDKKVRRIGAGLEKRGIPTIFSFPGGEPHVALAVFEKCDPFRLNRGLKKIAGSFPKFELRLSSVGSFPGKEGVLFLAPVVTPDLLRLNVLTHNLLEKSAGGVWDYYKPGWWVPHCTLSINLPPRKLIQGLDQVKKMDFGLVGRYQRLVFEEVSLDCPPVVRTLYSLPLSGKIKSKAKGK